MTREFAKDYSLPKVKFRSVRDTGKSRNAQKFFQYWDAIPEGKRDLAKVKIYRLWPVCDVKAVNANATIEWDTLTGAIPFPVDEYETAFLHKYGSGEWNVLMTEEGVSGVVMEGYFSAIDLERYPPKIDFRTLLRGNFKNQDYVKWLERQPGLQLPWTIDPARQEEEQNMNVAGEAISKLVESHERQADKIIELVEDKIDSQTEQQQQSIESTAANEAMKMVTNTANTIVEGMAKQMDKVIEQSGKQVINPKEILESVVEVADKLRGPDTTTGVFEKLFELQREETKYWRERAEASAPVSSEPQASGIDLLLEEGQKFKQLGDLFGWTGRRQRNDDEPPRQIEAPAKEHWLDILGRKLAENPALAITGVFALTNLAQTFMGRGKPVEEVQKLATQVNGQLTGQNQPPPNGDQERQRAQLQNFLRAIEPLFLKHFFDPANEELNGYSFAEDFLTAKPGLNAQLEFTPQGAMTELGQQQYNQIRAGGPIQFDRIVRDYPPIWNLVQGNMPKYQQFLKDFFEFPEAAARAAEERAKKVATVQQPN